MKRRFASTAARLAAAAAAALLIGQINSGTAQAVAYTWTGGGAGSFWGDPTNWGGAGFPGSVPGVVDTGNVGSVSATIVLADAAGVASSFTIGAFNAGTGSTNATVNNVGGTSNNLIFDVATGNASITATKNTGNFLTFNVGITLNDNLSIKGQTTEGIRFNRPIISGVEGTGIVIIGQTGSNTSTQIRHTMLNAASTYTGATVVQGSAVTGASTTAGGGKIQIGIKNALPVTTTLTLSPSTTEGGRLNLNGFDQTVAGLSGATGTAVGMITNDRATAGTSTFTIHNTADFTFSGSIIDAITAGNLGTTALSKNGAGNQTLGGNSTYTGATTVNAGTLTLTGALGATAVVVNGGIFTDNGTGVIASGGSVTATGGTAILSSVQAYTGLTAANAGSVLVDMASNASVLNAASTVATGGGTFQLKGAAGLARTQIVNGLHVNPGASVVEINNPGTSTTLDLRGAGGTSGITRNGGTVDFRATSGLLDTNTVIQTTQANVNGILGGWATVNSGAAFAANDGTGRIVAYTGYTDITHAGSTIAEAPAANVRINAAGSVGTVALGETTTNINTLTQSFGSAAMVETASRTLRFGPEGSVFVTSTGAALTIGTTAGSGTVTAGGEMADAAGALYLTNHSNNPLTINANVTDNGTGAVRVTKSGSGPATLAGANSYSGDTVVTGGILMVAGGLNGNALVLGAQLSLGGGVNGNATLAGGGTLEFSAPGTITGNLSVAGGTWKGAASVASVATSSTGVFTIAAGASLAANGNLSITGGTLASGSSASTIEGSILYTSSASSTFGGVIAGSGKTLTLNNTDATLTLTGVNTYTGLTTVTAGTLALSGGNDRLEPIGTLLLNGTSTVTFGGNSQTLSTLTTGNAATATVTLGDGSLTLNGFNALAIAPTAANTSYTLTAKTLSSVVIEKPGFTVSVSGLNNGTAASTADFTLSATSNRITSAGLSVGTSPGNSAGPIINSGRLHLGALNTIEVDNVQIGNLRSNATLDFQADLTSPSVSFRGSSGAADSRVITFLVGLQSAGATANATQIADFSRGSIDARFSTLVLGRGASATATAAVSGVFTMGTGTVDATTIVISDNTSGGANTNTGTFNQNAGVVLAGTITLGTRVGSATAPQLMPTYNLGTAATSATLKATVIRAGSGAVAATTVRKIVFNQGTIANFNDGTSVTDLMIDGTGTATELLVNIQLAGTAGHSFLAEENQTITVGTNTVISGGATSVLTKDGAGTLILGGANTYTGNTVVNLGTLLVSGSIATSATTVNAGGTLGGTGTAGAVSLLGGAIAPGASAGTLATGALSFTSPSTLRFELEAVGGTNDLINVTGDLTLDGMLDVTELPGFTDGTYRLLNYSGTLTNNGLDLSGSFTAAHPGSFIQAGGGEVNLIVVPEPTSCLLLGLGAMGLWLPRRRRAVG